MATMAPTAVHVEPLSFEEEVAHLMSGANAGRAPEDSPIKAVEEPYPGLRPFEEEQQSIFFGRERHSAEVLNLLSRQRVVAVVGESGCGKSSLVKAGVVPFVRGGLMDGQGTRWLVATM